MYVRIVFLVHPFPVAQVLMITLVVLLPSKSKAQSDSPAKSATYSPLVNPEAPPTRQEETQEAMKKKSWEMLFSDNGR